MAKNSKKPATENFVKSLHLFAQQLHIHHEKKNRIELKMFDANYYRAKPLSQTVHQPLACMGIYPAGANGQQPISMRSLVVLGYLGIYFMLSGATMIRVADSFQTYADGYWITTSIMITFFMGSLDITCRKELVDLINNFERTIEQSKFHWNKFNL